jgi:hypothetical protein
MDGERRSMNRRSHLTNEASGRFRITTLTSTYLLDFDATTITRRSGTSANLLGSVERPQRLDRVEVCDVGERGRFQLLLEGATVSQPLTTTVVVSIEEVDAAWRLEPHSPDESSTLHLHWQTAEGHGQLDDWGFLPILGAMLASGLAGGPLRLERAGRAATIPAPAAAGVTVTLTDRRGSHEIRLLDTESALLAARSWLSRAESEPAL